MRQFILGGKVAYGSGATAAAIASGAIAFAYNKDGVFTVDTDGTGITKEGMIVLGRPADNGGPIVLPFYRNRFSYSKMVYQAATKFEATVTIPTVDSIGDFTLIVAKKGVKFNERNKWTAMYHNTKLTTPAATIAAALAESINNNNSGVVAEAEDATITITAQNNNEDFAILGADELFGVEVTVTDPKFSYGDADYVKDLANKAAADAGFEYTYQDYANYLYPNYPLNPLKSDDSENAGFTIYTLRFAEPRAVKTTDEVINQIVQIAVPTGTAAITTIDKILSVYASK